MRALIDEQAPVTLQPRTKRKRQYSYRRRSKIGCYSAVGAIAAVDGRSREALYLKRVRKDLIDFVGGDPSPAQMLLINDLAYLSLRIELDHERILRGDYVESENNHDRYLANVQAKRRGLAVLSGLKGSDKPAPSLADLLSGNGEAA